MKRPVYDYSSLKFLRGMRERLRPEESFSYTETLQSIMVTPVFTCKKDEALKNIVKEMARRGISSVVVIDDSGAAEGILTERDVMKRIVAKGLSLQGLKVSDVMTPEPVTMAPEDTVYEALSTLQKHNIKHLPVCKDNRVVGIVTLRQLLKLRYPEPMVLISEIQQAQEPEDLREVKKKIPSLVFNKLSLGTSVMDIVNMVSLINHDIHRRAFDLAIARQGHVPLKFCIFVSGSHGRMESLLSADQDHGMIVQDSDEYYRLQEFFIRLTDEYSRILEAIGYPYCSGYIMSINPLWRKQLSEWKAQFRYWFNRQTRALGRYMSIIFDSKELLGEVSLFDEMMDEIFGQIAMNHDVLKVMREEQQYHKVPLTFLGNFITEKRGPHKGELDIKRSGLLFMVESIRLLAVRYAIRETSTLKRIQALVSAEIIHPDDGEYFEVAYQVLLYYCLVSQVEKALKNVEINTYIKPSRLSAYDRESLKHAFKALGSLQDLVASEFGELVI